MTYQNDVKEKQTKLKVSIWSNEITAVTVSSWGNIWRERFTIEIHYAFMEEITLALLK